MRVLPEKLNRSSVRWFIVGSTTFVIDTTIFVAAFHLTHLGIFANLISGTVSTTFNYLAHYKWSFVSDRSHRQSTVFYLIAFFGFLGSGTFLLDLLIDSGLSAFFAKVITTAFIAPISFLIMKFVTFRKNGVS